MKGCTESNIGTSSPIRQVSKNLSFNAIPGSISALSMKSNWGETFHLTDQSHYKIVDFERT